MSIRVFYDEVNFRLKSSGKIRKFLESVILGENKLPGDLKFVFVSDDRILDINQKFMGHDYFTDVIAFDLDPGSEPSVNGEIYVGIETVRRNALLYGVGSYNEVLRVMIHGTLHLCGYRDGTEQERKLMISKQERLLKELWRIV